MPKKKKVFARYTGDGFVFGVPAINLSRSEWYALSEERRNIALVTGTHVLVAKEEEPAEKESGEVNDG